MVDEICGSLSFLASALFWKVECTWEMPFPGNRGGASDDIMYSCHKLLKKSLRWIAIEMNEGIAFSLLLGLMWNLMQFEKTCQTSSWIARVFLYSRRRMARQTCPKSMGLVTIFEYNVISWKCSSVMGMVIKDEAVSVISSSVKKRSTSKFCIPRDVAMIPADWTLPEMAPCKTLSWALSHFHTEHR